jgi:hypothetical protein
MANPLRGARIERHKVFGVPRRISGLSAPKREAEPREIAEEFLVATAPRLHIDRESLRFDSVKSSILGSHVLYQQYRGETPVSGAWLRIDIAPDGRIFHVLNDVVPHEAVRRHRRRELIGVREAEANARAAIDARVRRVVSHELVEYVVDGVMKPCWKIILRSQKPDGSWKVYVNGEDGSIVERVDLVKRIAGRGRVFDPNPVSSLRDDTLTPVSALPAGAFREVDLQGLDDSGFLDGEYASTRKTTGRVQSAEGSFLFSNGDRAFREVMAYFHIDRVRRHLTDIGITGVLDRAVEVNIDAFKEDLSQYDPPSKAILFGAGGVPDAEDAEIIVHEFGHAIQDDQVPGFGEGGEARALGEGFGDFLSASFFAAGKAPAMQPMIGTWDAKGYPQPQACLRRVDSPKKYPKDIDNDIYDDGEIWSACLWQLRAQLGQAAAEKLIIASHHLLSRTASFSDAANAILVTDEQLNGGANAAFIRKVFTDRGILRRQRGKGGKS